MHMELNFSLVPWGRYGAGTAPSEKGLVQLRVICIVLVFLPRKARVFAQLYTSALPHNIDTDSPKPTSLTKGNISLGNIFVIAFSCYWVLLVLGVAYAGRSTFKLSSGRIIERRQITSRLGYDS